jgi:hypothetical protein
MTRAPRLSARMRALNEVAEIAEERARLHRDLSREYRREGAPIAADREGTVAIEADWIASLIRERMQNRRTP